MLTTTPHLLLLYSSRSSLQHYRTKVNNAGKRAADRGPAPKPSKDKAPCKERPLPSSKNLPCFPLSLRPKSLGKRKDPIDLCLHHGTINKRCRSRTKSCQSKRCDRARTSRSGLAWCKIETKLCRGPKTNRRGIFNLR